MFERFTDRARRVVVISQEEARQLQHNYIGTEHLLLGLLAVPESVALMVLSELGMTLEATRDEVRARVGTGTVAMTGHIPFTPRAKKILELSLREALKLQHNYIGTEHILLGLVSEGEGVGAQLIAAHGGSLDAVRQAVTSFLATAAARKAGHRARSQLFGNADVPATPAAQASVSGAVQLAGSLPVGSHHLLLAALRDPDSAAARTLVSLGVDLDQAREALRTADVTGTSDEQPEERGRRHMTLRASDTSLTIEATDPDIVKAAQAAAEALGDRTAPHGVIRGDLPVSTSLGDVWLTLKSSLEDIRRKATLPKPGASQPGEPGRGENAQLRDPGTEEPPAAG